MEVDMFNYKGTKCTSIEEFLDLFPQENSERENVTGEFSSPFRSTIPLIILYKDFPEFLNPFGIAGEYIFEYETKPKKGIGRASCSDLVGYDSKTCLVVEAKRTEPPYDLVEKWYDGSKNRKLVLEGWLEYINEYSGKNIKITDIMDIPYQAIHRIASACSMKKDVTRLAYFLFDLNDKEESYYKDVLRKLKRIIGNSVIYNYCLYKIEKHPLQGELEQRWMNGERNLEKEVKKGIIDSKLMKIVKKEIEDI